MDDGEEEREMAPLPQSPVGMAKMARHDQPWDGTTSVRRGRDEPWQAVSKELASVDCSYCNDVYLIWSPRARSRTRTPAVACGIRAPQSNGCREDRFVDIGATESTSAKRSRESDGENQGVRRKRHKRHSSYQRATPEPIPVPEVVPHAQTTRTPPALLLVPESPPEPSGPSLPPVSHRSGHMAGVVVTRVAQGVQTRGMKVRRQPRTTAGTATSAVISGEKLHACDELGCNRAFTRSFCLRRHKMIHKGLRPHVCAFADCGQAFARSDSLKDHRRVHTGERPFVCDEPGCSGAFTRSRDLKVHKRVHTNERPFVCGYGGWCGWAFVASTHLAKHKMTHTGARPYVCDFADCDQAFARSDSLKRHQQRMHDKPRT